MSPNLVYPKLYIFKSCFL
uniref:Uncharacterized protein n=1 Tax=Anguilla anguilla TaxID=7936 RepID=A0A0E9XFN4_ANGAN